MPVKIAAVDVNSAAERAGIKKGETLVSINGKEIFDVLDYRFYETDRTLQILLRNVSGEEREVRIVKREYQSIGLSFDTYLMDRQHSCRNRCIFCFIDQLPPGMRESLYFKDDDSRLSFLFGNYVTLTNMSEREVDRIIAMHISPINISVHTTNPDLRCKMMGNRFAGKSLEILYRLAQAGIRLNCQFALCPGINDGAELERSLNDLLPLYPAVQSVALVPLGVTRFREGLYPLKPYTREGAQAVIETAERYGASAEKRYGKRICYAADEFYLKAGLPIPRAEFYGEFDQLENGVGLLANLKQEFEDARLLLEDEALPGKQRSVTMATGVAAQPFLSQLLDGLRNQCHNLTCNVVAIRNEFFGETITVAGLVTGGDIIRQLKGRPLGDVLLLPRVMLRYEGDVFLDDVTVETVEKELGIPVQVVQDDGYELLNAIIGGDRRAEGGSCSGR